MDQQSFYYDPVGGPEIDGILERISPVSKVLGQLSVPYTAADRINGYDMANSGAASLVEPNISDNSIERIVERMSCTSRWIEQFARPPAWLEQINSLQRQVEQILCPMAEAIAQCESIARTVSAATRPMTAIFETYRDSLQPLIRSSTALDQMAPYLAKVISAMDQLPGTHQPPNLFANDMVTKVQQRQEQIDEWLRSGGDPDDPIPDLRDDQNFVDFEDDVMELDEEQVSEEKVRQIVAELTYDSEASHDPVDGRSPHVEPAKPDSTVVTLLLHLLPLASRENAYELAHDEALCELLESRKARNLPTHDVDLTEFQKTWIILLILLEVIHETVSEYKQSLHKG